jgi:hypothetical protein
MQNTEFWKDVSVVSVFSVVLMSLQRLVEDSI